MGRDELREMSWVIGVDEVGRGALAGPVVVAAAVIPKGIRFERRELGPLKDSKQLSAKQREAWYAYFLENPKVSFAVARVYPRQIEKRNISRAANLAALRAYGKLTKKSAKTKIFLDGGLYLSNREWQAKKFKHAETLIKADEKIAAVAVASIIAKVHRDRFMQKLAQKYPRYGFDIHKGYGTKIHRAAIETYGSCLVHRLTFIT